MGTQSRRGESTEKTRSGAIDVLYDNYAWHAYLSAPTLSTFVLIAIVHSNFLQTSTTTSAICRPVRNVQNSFFYLTPPWFKFTVGIALPLITISHFRSFIPSCEPRLATANELCF